MRKLSLLLPALPLLMTLACADDTSSGDGETGETVGDGDGDGDPTGDGDGDPTGDGDGDPTGDGDGDPTGDGDGDPTGDGDGDPTGDGDGDPTGDGDGDGDPLPGEAMLRVVHLGLDAPAVDIYLDDAVDPAVTNLAFESGTDYLAIPAGPHVVSITAAGAPVADAVLVTPAIDLADGVKYSAAAYDYLAELSVLALVDDNADIAEGEVRLQIAHTAADVGQVDIWAIAEPPVLLVEDLDFGAAQTIDIPAGAGIVGIDVDNDMIPDLTFDVPNLGAGNLVNVYAVNEDGGSPVFLLAHLPDGTTARLDAHACGNDIIEYGEVCDGADLDGETCEELGFDGGDLSCAVDCSAYVEDACVLVDWGDDFEAGAVLGAEWVGNWFGTTTMPQAGSFAAENFDIGDSQTSSMSVTLNYSAAGSVTFWRRTSTEANWDFLRFFIDDVQQAQWSGVTPWTQQTYPVSAGVHTLRWSYVKDGSVSSNADTVWVDEITTVNGKLQ
jgi:hypothetical protein